MKKVEADTERQELMGKERKLAMNVKVGGGRTYRE